MRTTFWASLLWLVSLAWAPAQADAVPPALPKVQAELAAPGRTRLRITFAAQAPQSLVVARDAQVPAQAEADRVDVVAALDTGVVVLVETYPSRLNGGAGQCGAGEERFLRVVSTAPPAHQTYSRKLASCWRDTLLDTEFGDEGLRWSPASRELRIEWLSGPTGGKPESLTLRVAPDGRVKEVKPA